MGGPIKAKSKQLDPWDDRGYIFWKTVPIEGFVMMQKLRCGYYAYLQYYNSMGSAANRGRGGFITEYVRAICFTHDGIVLRDEIMNMRDVAGKNTIQIRSHCFDSRLKVPTSGGSSNKIQKKNQSQVKKKRQLEKAVASGRRKGRSMK